MTQRERDEADLRRRRMRLAEALAYEMHFRTSRHKRGTSTFAGRDEAEVERLRRDVNELRHTGKLGRSVRTA